MKAWFVLMLVAIGISVLTACGTGASVQDGSNAERTGTIHLALSPAAADDIGTVRVDVSLHGKPVASRTLIANPGAGGGPGDGGAGDDARLPLGDAFFVLPPATYTVVATPFDANGAPSESCSAATTSARVLPSLTTEVTLALFCNSAANGGVNVVVTTTHPPVITNLDFDPSPFTRVCEAVKITVQATSPDGAALSYAWAVTARPPDDDGGLPPGARAELSASGASAVFATESSGDYTLKVVVTDANRHAASLSFPIHVLAGDGCAPTGSDNAGATQGALTIRGHVLDQSGSPLVGARITLDGAAQAVRFSDLTGAYAFHVNSGAYALAAAGPCQLVPSAQVLGNLTADATQDFAAASGGCVTAASSNVAASGSVVTLAQGSNILGRSVAVVEPRGDVASAMARLAQLENEQSSPFTSITVNGFPGIERRVVVPPQGPTDQDIAGGGTADSTASLELTTAVAAGDTVVRFEAYLPADAGDATVQLFLASHRNTVFDSIAALHGPRTTTVSTVTTMPAIPPPLANAALTPGSLTGNFGELQIAASDTEHAVVYATQFGILFRSGDDGTTVQPSVVPSLAGTNFGDPTIAVGAPDSALAGKQAFYFAQLTSTVTNTYTARGVQVFRSTDGGQTFVSPGTGGSAKFAVDCSLRTSGCYLPDQPQFAADRVSHSSGGDRVYAIWRVFQADRSFTGLAISCSNDGGVTWSAPDASTLTGTGHDFPRITVAIDGSVFVVYGVTDFADSTNAARVAIQKFSACGTDANGVVKIVPDTTHFPVYVTASQEHVGRNCAAGLDRCATTNYMVASDDTNANNVFVTYATSAGNPAGDDVHVSQSSNGGVDWTNDVLANASRAGARFMPWICSTNGRAFVSWYDRRDSASQPDLTAYYMTSVTPASSMTNLSSDIDHNVSGLDDPECLAGFPAGARDAIVVNACTDLPAGVTFGGQCALPGFACRCVISQQTCTSDADCTTTGDRCQSGSGVPTYGDYNGAACARGRLFMSWASTTPPLAAPFGKTCSEDSSDCSVDSDCCSGTCLHKQGIAQGICVSSQNPLCSGLCLPVYSKCKDTFGYDDSGLCATNNCQQGVCLPDVALYNATWATDVCGGTFTNLNVDSNNCGACGNVCNPNSSCFDGQCSFVFNRIVTPMPTTIANGQRDMVITSASNNCLPSPPVQLTGVATGGVPAAGPAPYTYSWSATIVPSTGSGPLPIVFGDAAVASTAGLPGNWATFLGSEAHSANGENVSISLQVFDSTGSSFQQSQRVRWVCQ